MNMVVEVNKQSISPLPLSLPDKKSSSLLMISLFTMASNFLAKKMPFFEFEYACKITDTGCNNMTPGQFTSSDVPISPSIKVALMNNESHK